MLRMKTHHLDGDVFSSTSRWLPPIYHFFRCSVGLKVGSGCGQCQCCLPVDTVPWKRQNELRGSRQIQKFLLLRFVKSSTVNVSETRNVWIFSGYPAFLYFLVTDAFLQGLTVLGFSPKRLNTKEFCPVQALQPDWCYFVTGTKSAILSEPNIQRLHVA